MPGGQNRFSPKAASVLMEKFDSRGMKAGKGKLSLHHIRETCTLSSLKAHLSMPSLCWLCNLFPQKYSSPIHLDSLSKKYFHLKAINGIWSTFFFFVTTDEFQDPPKAGLEEQWIHQSRLSNILQLNKALKQKLNSFFFAFLNIKNTQEFNIFWFSRHFLGECE